MPTWMKIAPTSAATKRRGWKMCRQPASAVPTAGAIAAGSVRMLAAISQMRIPLGVAALVVVIYAPVGELREIGLALLEVGVAALLRLLAHVEEEVRVVGQLLDAGQAVLVGVEARLEQAQREGGDGEHLAAPLHGLFLEPVDGHDRVDQAHLERLVCVVLAAEEPDLLGLLRADEAGEDGRAEAAVEGADLRAGLAEARVVGSDREVADDVQHVAAADRVASDHRHDGLGHAPDLDVQVGHVEASNRLVLAGLGRVGAGHVAAAAAAGALVSARAERLGSLPGQDHDAQ